MEKGGGSCNALMHAICGHFLPCSVIKMQLVKRKEDSQLDLGKTHLPKRLGGRQKEQLHIVKWIPLSLRLVAPSPSGEVVKMAWERQTQLLGRGREETLSLKFL